MRLGYLFGYRARALYWLPEGWNPGGDFLLRTHSAIEQNGGFVLGTTTKIGFYAKEIPASYHCPTCKILLTDTSAKDRA